MTQMTYACFEVGISDLVPVTHHTVHVPPGLRLNFFFQKITLKSKVYYIKIKIQEYVRHVKLYKAIS